VRWFSTGKYYHLKGRDAVLFGRNCECFIETYCLHLHVGSFFAVKMEAISYFETMTGLYQITIVTMVIVSYLDLLSVLCDSFFCSGQTPAPLLVLNPAGCHTDLVSHSFAIQINNFA
jgi:hypothetical protein